MIGVVRVQPCRRNMSMAPWWTDVDMDVESVLGQVENWMSGDWAMRPRGWSTPRCGSNTVGSLRSTNFDPICLLRQLATASLPSERHTCSKVAPKHNNNKNDNNKSMDQENHLSKEGEGEVQESASARTSAKTKEWQHTVNMAGCDAVRAWAEDGVVKMEGRGRRGESFTIIHHETRLPPHLNPDTLTATLKKEGQLVVSAKSSSEASVVSNIPITTEEEQQKQETVKTPQLSQSSTEETPQLSQSSTEEEPKLALDGSATSKAK